MIQLNKVLPFCLVIVAIFSIASYVFSKFEIPSRWVHEKKLYLPEIDGDRCIIKSDENLLGVSINVKENQVWSVDVREIKNHDNQISIDIIRPDAKYVIIRFYGVTPEWSDEEDRVIKKWEDQLSNAITRKCR